MMKTNRDSNINIVCCRRKIAGHVEFFYTKLYIIVEAK